MTEDALPLPEATGVDELRLPRGDPRPGGESLLASITRLGTAGLLARRAQVRGLLEDDGVTYGARPRPWDVDPVPVVVDAVEWRRLRLGLLQRAQLLDLLLADLYGPRATLRHGLLPPEVVFGHAGFLRDTDRIAPGAAHQLLILATDLARDGDGGWRVLADRAQAPSGAGYAMQNRRVVSRVMAGLYRDLRPARLRTFFHALKGALEEAAPASAEAARVVQLTPGASAETAFDQAFLATLLGHPLVEGGDLTVRDGRVWMRSLGRPVPVDVVLRRVDAWYADPLELRPDSRLGVAGLLEATRVGHVRVVNPLGAGVLENPGLVPFLPALARALLGAPLLLDDVETFWCGDDVSRRYVTAHLDQLVIRPIARGPGRSGRFGWQLSAAAADELRREIEADAWRWCAQRPLPLSQVPVVTATGLQPRGLVLRTFAVGRGGGYELMAGGLARAAAEGAGLLVSGQAGAVAKDVWVQAGEPSDGRARPAVSGGGRPGGAPGPVGAVPGDAATKVAPAKVAPAKVAPAKVAPAMAPRVAEDLFWLGRYAERAEDGARMLRVVADLAEDYAGRPGTPGAATLQVLLGALAEVTGTPVATSSGPELARGGTSGPAVARGSGGGSRGLSADLLALTVDADLPGGLGYAVRRSVEAAHAVREQLSLDTWVVLGSLDRVLAELATAAEAAPTDLPPLQPTLARVLEGMLALAGLGAESMVRDAGWALMDAGRRLERGQQLLTVLRQTVVVERDPAVDDLVLESVLLAAESVITHRRRLAAGTLPGGPPSVQLAGVLQLLLADRANPRALAYQLDRLAEDFDQLGDGGLGHGGHAPGAPGDGGLGDEGHVPEALGAQAREAAARLQAADLTGLVRSGSGGRRPGLTELLDRLSLDLERLSAAVVAGHFGRGAPPRPLPAGPGWEAS